MGRPAVGIDAHDVCFAHRHDDVLHRVSATISGGEVAAVAGSNGSGKSTLLEILAGVRQARRGRVERRGRLALVVQRPLAPESLPLTVADTVMIGMWSQGLRIGRLARRAAVARALDRVDLGHLADRSLTELSGGQRQRTFLAQGIVSRPDILLLDEPGAGFDAENLVRLQRILREEADRGAAVGCVTHDEKTIALADRVVRLEHGVRVK